MSQITHMPPAAAASSSSSSDDQHQHQTTVVEIMKRVSFATTQTAYCNPQQLTVEERKSLCWYSEEELVPSRDDARQAMQMLQESGGLVPADICIRGVEKYADAMSKVMGQRRLVRSVLEQQRKTPPEGLANISRYLSRPFKELARYFATKSIEDDEYLKEQPSPSAASTTSAPASAPVLEENDAPDDCSESTEIPTDSVSTKRRLDSVGVGGGAETREASSRNVKQRILFSE